MLSPLLFNIHRPLSSGDISDEITKPLIDSLNRIPGMHNMQLGEFRDRQGGRHLQYLNIQAMTVSSSVGE